MEIVIALILGMFIGANHEDVVPTTQEPVIEEMVELTPFEQYKLKYNR